MTTHKQVITLAKECFYCHEDAKGRPEYSANEYALERFYSIAFDAGRVAEREHWACGELESLRQQVYNLNRLCEFDNKTNEQLLQIVSDHLSGFVLCDNPPVAWTHSCNVLCLDNVELWIDRCPHCGKPAPKGMTK